MRRQRHGIANGHYRVRRDLCLLQALAGNDIEAIKAATEALMGASQAFSQKLYEAAARDGDAAGTSASGAAGNDDGDIVDA